MEALGALALLFTATMYHLSSPMDLGNLSSTALKRDVASSAVGAMCVDIFLF